MLSQRMLDALTDQVNAEHFSSYLYLSMSVHFEATNFLGFAKWMQAQAKEESEHALKIQQYILDRGSRVVLKPIEAPTSEWDTPLAVFENALEHEHKVTARIHALADLAATEKDYATSAMLQWFITEQVEEEATLEPIVARLRACQGSLGGVYWLDHHLGKRGSEG